MLNFLTSQKLSLLVTAALLALSLFLSICSAKRRTNDVDVAFYREKVKNMFYHAYEGYLKYAYPYDELKPLTCKGHDTWGSYSLTLIDAMDTLVVMGNYSEFRRIAHLVMDKGENAFDMDINVSVFETNIRIVGGLISAHLLMKRAGMELEAAWPCSGPLLRMADSIARKLLPAFDTPTGMPYGTVNLRNGVPKGETTVTCTAGVGTFIVEFGTLSRLTGDPIFEKTAVRAIRSLWKYRSPLGLLGNHIDVKTGKWTAQDAGIGGGVDSYFEYLVKGSVLFNLPELTHLFREYEVSIKKYLKKDDWYMWAQMNKGSITLPMFTSLDAFWPSIQMMLGDVDAAMKTLHNFQMVWRQFGFTPEYYNIPKSEPHKGREGYPLRPELIESLMYLYRATKDPALLKMGVDIVESIERQARTSCGYATIKDVRDHRLDDRMESFFLAETTKYLYLLFDTENFIHNNGSHGQVINTPSGSCVIEAGGYVFNTEAHPIDLAAVHCCSAKKLEEDKVLEDFHDNLDLLSLLNLVEDEDDFGMKDWRKRRNKKDKEGKPIQDESLKQKIVGEDGVENKEDIPANLVKDKDIDVKQTNAGKNEKSSDEKLEVLLPSGPEIPEVGRTGSNAMLTPNTTLTEVEKNIMKIFMDTLNIKTENMNFVDTAEKLESEYKGTEYEKIVDHLVEKLLQEGIDNQIKSRDVKNAKGGESDDIVDVSSEGEKAVLSENISKNGEILKDLLSELSALMKEKQESSSFNSSEKLPAGEEKIYDTNRTGVEGEETENEEDDNGAQNSSADVGTSEDSKILESNEEEEFNPALEKLRHHLETQFLEEEKEKNLESKESAKLTKDYGLESRRENILSLTKKAIQLFKSLSSGSPLSLEGVDGEASMTQSSPSIINLYATLGKQSLRYLDDPSSMLCPAQPFRSRLSANGEFLVDERG